MAGFGFRALHTSKQRLHALTMYRAQATGGVGMLLQYIVKQAAGSKHFTLYYDCTVTPCTPPVTRSTPPVACACLRLLFMPTPPVACECLCLLCACLHLLCMPTTVTCACDGLAGAAGMVERRRAQRPPTQHPYAQPQACTCLLRVYYVFTLPGEPVFHGPPRHSLLLLLS